MTPITRGVLLAMAAALAFGLSTPLVQLAGRGAGPFVTAALLYGGAAALQAVLGGARPLPRSSWGRLAIVALFGAFVAPALLAAGLARSSSTSASLLLNLEAGFTVLLGALVNREAVGRRVWVAVSVIAAGGALLVLDRDGGGLGLDLGLVLVVGATVAWSLDNTFSRALSDLDIARVVTGKAAVGTLLSCAVAFGLGEALPSLSSALGLLACGAIGYGASLRLYLLAQRTLGSARTGSVFAVGPFVGALAAGALGEPVGGWLTILGGLAMAVGVYLHLTEVHAHEHVHPALRHSHPHNHRDGHHGHSHPGIDPDTLHTHDHEHEPLVHTHVHGEDLHHRHH